MPQNTRLLFLAGSSRDGSHNKMLAKRGMKIASEKGHPATFADLGDYPMPIYDGDLEARDGAPENATKLKSLMEAHQGVFIACPEYNASVTPLLKNTIDWISRVKDDTGATGQVYKSRVFALGAASPGSLGGMRGLIAMRTILEVGLNALVLPDMMSIALAGKAFASDGRLADAAAEQRFDQLITKLHHAARIMRSDAAP